MPKQMRLSSSALPMMFKPSARRPPTIAPSFTRRCRCVGCCLKLTAPFYGSDGWFRFEFGFSVPRIKIKIKGQCSREPHTHTPIRIRTRAELLFFVALTISISTCGPALLTFRLDGHPLVAQSTIHWGCQCILSYIIRTNHSMHIVYHTQDTTYKYLNCCSETDMLRHTSTPAACGNCLVVSNTFGTS